MSIIHTYNAPCSDPLPISALDVRKAPASLFVLVARLAARPLNAFHHHLAMRRIERFSARRLDDIGFERDRDGTIRPRPVTAARALTGRASGFEIGAVALPRPL
ncbi:hypothetical protein [Shinella sp. M31]|uniref:hypothetical protein n=1 Tax=Shinella sp. M31 TaxID=3368615 RepID=UPI003BA3DE76